MVVALFFCPFAVSLRSDWYVGDRTRSKQTVGVRSEPRGAPREQPLNKRSRPLQGVIGVCRRGISATSCSKVIPVPKFMSFSILTSIMNGLFVQPLLLSLMNGDIVVLLFSLSTTSGFRRLLPFSPVLDADKVVDEPFVRQRCRQRRHQVHSPVRCTTAYTTYAGTHGPFITCQLHVILFMHMVNSRNTGKRLRVVCYTEILCLGINTDVEYVN